MSDTSLPQRASDRRWLVTGAAGFIGSHIVEELLRRGETVVALDNLATGSRRNIDEALAALPAASAQRLSFIEADIRDTDACNRAAAGATHVLHQAALGSVPRSMAEPLTTLAVNVDGFANVIEAARHAGVRRFVYASSSSVYGDSEAPQKREGDEGRPLSPYAASKRMNEILADAYATAFGMSVIGLRYFNVYGPRQDPAGPYAAVVPRWIGDLLDGRQPVLFGDGETSRDFTYVADVVAANIGAATAEAALSGGACNIAFGAATTLNQLYAKVRAEVARVEPSAARIEPRREPDRPGDVRHSLADTRRAAEAFGYRPTVALDGGLRRTVDWFAR